MGNDPSPLIRELLDAGLASLIDPAPIQFRLADEKGVRPLHRALQEDGQQIRRFSRPLARNAFLCGCLDFTENKPLEHLIVGYGRSSGTTTWVDAVQHVIGEERQVSIPSDVAYAAKHFLLSQPRAELIVFHNHPPKWINAIFDNLPIASSNDRELLAARYRQPVIVIKELMGEGTIRFYVGENGFVREFRMPGILRTLEQLGIILPP